MAKFYGHLMLVLVTSVWLLHGHLEGQRTSWQLYILATIMKQHFYKDAYQKMMNNK
jgi:hypothetical protein